MKISKGICFSLNQLIELYNDAEWYSYSKEPDQLWKAFENSFDVYSIFENEELVGIARLIGDGITTIILQDLIIKQNYRNKGYGNKVIELIKADYLHVRQLFLLCDKDKMLETFYKSNGFSSIEHFGISCFGIIK